MKRKPMGFSSPLLALSTMIALFCSNGCLSTNTPIHEEVSLLLGDSSELRALSLVRGADGVLFVAGHTQASFGGQTLQGDQDVYVAKLSATKEVLWVRFFGTNAREATGVRNLVIDTQGDLWLAGTTTGSFPHFKNRGGDWSALDPFLAKISPDGDIRWIQQKTQKHDAVIQGITANTDGGVAVTGWTKSTLTSADVASAVNESGFKNPTGFIAKINSDGLWTHMKLIEDQGLGSYGRNIVVSGQDIYVGGSTFSGLNETRNQGGVDAFLMKLNSNLHIEWATLFGGASNDLPSGELKLSSDGTGIFVSGVTGTALFGKRAFGGTDSFVGRFSARSGKKEWFRQMGTSSEEDIQGIEVFSDNQIVVVGTTQRNQMEQGQSRRHLDLSIWRMKGEDGELLNESRVDSVGDGAFIVQLQSDIHEPQEPWKLDL